MKRPPRRGDVFWVALDPAVGTEIRKARPAVILSNDSCNRHGGRLVVVPVTSSVTTLYPGDAAIVVAGKAARALGEQLRSIDKPRLLTRLGRLTPAEMAAVEEAVRITLDL